MAIKWWLTRARTPIMSPLTSLHTGLGITVPVFRDGLLTVSMAFFPTVRVALGVSMAFSWVPWVIAVMAASMAISLWRGPLEMAVSGLFFC